MKSYFPYFILSIFIISNKLFLFNEEFLILICFFSFCSLIYFKLKSSIQVWFNSKIHSNEFLITSSMINTEEHLKTKYSLNNKLLRYKKLFILLKNYYYDFLNNFLSSYLLYLENNYKYNILSKLDLLKKIESEYSKLILLLITNKISSIATLTNFYSVTFPINRFKLIDKINKQTLFSKI